ncbi:DNA-binding CsgD family transcriptional regulator [Hoeflea halophila]|uniref:DNA-binding CsgD family transcriptional regulator n=2 Tax=Hoeflea halophila TaxID=714899 RepID=A0A286IDV0_9HYPH|nr:DNA-binding CsgD family transcriptional regulator [Hoeflea halophila]
MSMRAQSQQQKLPSICEQLDNCQTQFDILRLLRELTAGYGYKYFFVANGATAEEKSFSEAIVITSAPSELVQSHEAVQPVASNPLVGILSQTSAPVEYRLDGSAALAPADFRVFMEGLAATYSLDCAFVVPVYHPDHGPAAVFFVGERVPMSMGETAELALYAHMVHQKLRQVSARPPKPDSPLTERERECLVWTSVGKTSVEIAQILNLSEHTVNHYLNNAARKFDAVNRTQAVAHGLRFGFID